MTPDTAAVIPAGGAGLRMGNQVPKQFLPLAGGTAPVTLEATILQENASFLGNMAFYQLVSPGWPMIWGATAGLMDMRTGRWSGRSESVLMSLALTEMAKTVYQLPASTFGQCSINARGADFEGGIDAIFSDSILGLAGVDNIWGPADLDGATLVDLDYVVLTTESIRTARRLRRGLTIDAEHLMTDLILEQGFEVLVVSDATAAAKVPDGDGYAAAVTNFRFMANAVRSTEQVATELVGAETAGAWIRESRGAGRGR